MSAYDEPGNKLHNYIYIYTVIPIRSGTCERKIRKFVQDRAVEGPPLSLNSTTKHKTLCLAQG